MHSGNRSDLPNPFAPSPKSKWSSERLISAVKVFAIAVVGFVVLVAVTSRGPDWLANRLSQNFDSLDVDQKQSRLVQLSQLGQAGISPLMVGLSDADPQVNEKAIALIRGLQTSWTTLPKSESNQNQLILVAAIGKSGNQFAADEKAWASELLNQVIVESVDDAGPASKQIYQTASQALAILNQASEPMATPIDLQRSPLLQSPELVSQNSKIAHSQSIETQGVALKMPASIAQPLPMTVAIGDASWTDWPPRPSNVTRTDSSDQQPSNTASVVTTTNFADPSPTVTQPSVAEPFMTQTLMTQAPIALASLSMPTTTATPIQQASFQDVDPQPATFQQASFAQAEIQEPELQEATVRQTSAEIELPPVAKPELQNDINTAATSEFTSEFQDASANVSSTPVDRTDEQATADPQTVAIDWVSADTNAIVWMLASEQPASVRNQAKAELDSRGLTKTELSVAAAIANSTPGYRIELIRQLTGQETVDARPWLLMMLTDRDREVKLEAVSAIARMLDPQLRKELRLRMIDEPDQKVVLRIRRVLNLSTLDQ